MATWIAHLRIAENILRSGFNFEAAHFAVGNIGPDSGVPDKNWSNFDPPKKITHWVEGEKEINANGFYDKHLNNINPQKDAERYSFLMGYYVHLLTDIEWSKFSKERNALYKEKLNEDPSFIWTIKKDWYGLDYLYLYKHPGCIFYKLFTKIRAIPDYLEYFPKGSFERQVKYITEFYLGQNDETKEGFIYLTEEEMDQFVSRTTEKIKNQLIKLKPPQPEYINIDDALRLRKFDNIFDFALPWYLDQETVKLVDGENAHIYDEEKLAAMYHYLNNKGELYFIEIKSRDKFIPIGDVTFWQKDMPIVIGDKDYRGMGIGYKVIKALVARGIELEFDKLYIGEIYSYNIASQKAFEKAGFKRYRDTKSGYSYMLDLSSK